MFELAQRQSKWRTQNIILLSLVFQSFSFSFSFCCMSKTTHFRRHPGLLSWQAHGERFMIIDLSTHYLQLQFHRRKIIHDILYGIIHENPCFNVITLQIRSQLSFIEQKLVNTVVKSKILIKCSICNIGCIR